MNKGAYWDFEVLDPTDYEIVFTMQASNKIFNKIFNDSKIALIRAGKDVKGANPETIDKFAIPDKFYNYLHVILTRFINGVKSEVGKDKIVILSSRVTGGCFMRDSTRNWVIKVKVGGEYVNKN